MKNSKNEKSGPKVNQITLSAKSRKCLLASTLFFGSLVFGFYFGKHLKGTLITDVDAVN